MKQNIPSDEWIDKCLRECPPASMHMVVRYCFDEYFRDIRSRKTIDERHGGAGMHGEGVGLELSLETIVRAVFFIAVSKGLRTFSISRQLLWDKPWRLLNVSWTPSVDRDAWTVTVRPQRGVSFEVETVDIAEAEYEIVETKQLPPAPKLLPPKL